MFGVLLLVFKLTCGFNGTKIIILKSLKLFFTIRLGDSKNDETPMN